MDLSFSSEVKCNYALVNERRCQRANEGGKGMESAAIGDESRIQKRVLVSCAVAKPSSTCKILVDSRIIRPTVPNQGATGEKGIWAVETKGRALSFAVAWALPESEKRGPSGLSLAPCDSVLAGQVGHVTYKIHPSTQTMQQRASIARRPT